MISTQITILNSSVIDDHKNDIESNTQNDVESSKQIEDDLKPSTEDKHRRPNQPKMIRISNKMTSNHNHNNSTVYFSSKSLREYSKDDSSPDLHMTAKQNMQKTLNTSKVFVLSNSNTQSMKWVNLI